MKTAIFLGAGASAAEGAPPQSDLFREYFKSIRDNYRYEHCMEYELADFFNAIFGIDVYDENLDNVIFPTFEEALGILDLTERRGETFRKFPLENIADNSNRIGFLRQYLVLLMAKVIHEKLKTSKGLHKKLVNKLRAHELLKETIFVTTNYDILIDNALMMLYPETLIDYGVDFTNFDNEGDWKRPDINSIKLYKVHGSLNWLYCPTCNNLTLTPKEKKVIRLMTDVLSVSCPECNSLQTPVIIPPTFFKDMSNVFLSVIWNKAENSLREVEHIIFCGYSFPDADIHVKYLIKRIQTNRTSKLKVTVINNHKRKKHEIAEEELRFKRFLGSDVNYTDWTFEQFAKNPIKFLTENSQNK